MSEEQRSMASKDKGNWAKLFSYHFLEFAIKIIDDTKEKRFFFIC